MLRRFIALGLRRTPRPISTLPSLSTRIFTIPAASFGRASYWPRRDDDKGQAQVAQLRQLAEDEDAYRAVQKLRQALVVEGEEGASEAKVVWTPESRRIGMVARKVGMTQLYDERGVRFPVTVLEVDRCQVVQVKDHASVPQHATSRRNPALVNVQIGAGLKPLKKVTRALRGHFCKASVEPKRKLVEMPVTQDAVLPEGLEIDIRHFVPGQYVDVRGVTRGKGFAGGMKRWGFSGQGASHGVSKTHRALGSTGNTGAGRVFPGKKMPGRMGGKNATVMNLMVYKLDVENSLMFVTGAVPGAKGSYVTVRDALRKSIFTPENPPPFPTWVPTGEEDDKVKELIAPVSDSDPFAFT